VVSLPDGTDPDDFLSERGAEALQILLDQAPEAFDYRLEAISTRYDLKSVEGRQAVARDMGGWIAASPSAVARSGYWEKLADCLKLPQQVVIEEMESVRRSRRKTRIQEKEEDEAAPKGLSKPSQAQIAKKGLLALVFESPEFAAPTGEFWRAVRRDPGDEGDPMDSLLDRLAAWCAEMQAFRPEPFREKMEKEGFSELLARILVGEPVPANQKKAFGEYCQTIRYHLVQRLIALQLSQLKEQEGGADSKFSREWTRQAYQLEQERYGLGVNR
jgi:DNA primase